MLIASSITGITGVDGVQVAPAAVNKPEAAAEVKESAVQEKSSKSPEASQDAAPEKRLTVEEYVRKYFSDIPIMIEIAKCESRFRQYDTKGEVLRGEQNYLDRGVMQINEYYHNEDSEKLGFNILTLEGNTAYARYLFDRYGVSPWVSSAPCWGKTAAYSAYKNLAVN
jgi:hypothetical protein